MPRTAAPARSSFRSAAMSLTPSAKSARLKRVITRMFFGAQLKQAVESPFLDERAHDPEFGRPLAYAVNQLRGPSGIDQPKQGRL